MEIASCSAGWFLPGNKIESLKECALQAGSVSWKRRILWRAHDKLRNVVHVAIRRGVVDTSHGFAFRVHNPRLLNGNIRVSTFHGPHCLFKWGDPMKLCCFKKQLYGMTYTDGTINYIICTEVIGILNLDIQHFVLDLRRCLIQRTVLRRVWLVMSGKLHLHLKWCLHFDS